MNKLAILFFSLLFSINSFAAEAFFMQHAISSPDAKFTEKKFSEESKTIFYKIKIKYPNLISKDVLAEKFNAEVSSIISDEVNQFKNEIQKNSVNSKKIPTNLRNNTFYGFYDAAIFKTNDHAIVTVRFNNEINFAGSAHPSRSLNVINYDLTAGKKLTFNDLFKSDSNYLPIIADFAKQQLKQKIPQSNNWIDKGTAPELQNYSHWNVLSEGILFTFDEYQVAPRIFGLQEILVPYKTLESVLSKTTPFAACVKQNGCG